jgi:hypothetical protein
MPPERSYDEIEPFADFRRVVDASVFEPVPDSHILGLSDVTNSTTAILAGRYKAVNLAGAAVISAVMNALNGKAFAFVFGGDGATYLVAPEDRTRAARAAAETAAWVRDELDLELRIAFVPVEAIRAAGLDLRVARFAASPSVSYAILSGGGLAWAEAQMKAGSFRAEPAPPGARPDLSGLSCRWRPLESRNGTILSLIVRPEETAAPEAFAAVVHDLIGIVERDAARAGHPVPVEGPPYRWPAESIGLEARAGGPSRSTMLRWAAVAGESLLALALFRTGLPLGRFDPNHYRRQTTLNTDFRKFDDGLRMTVDCSLAAADAVERRLASAPPGTVRYGTHRQASALMTCIVPSPLMDNHLHFVDGAGGGYAAAAASLK